MLLEERPVAVSFHFGLPPTEKIEALRDAGIVLMATVTNMNEAGKIAAARLDEAGGHRGMFDPALDDERLGTRTARAIQLESNKGHRDMRRLCPAHRTT